MESIHIACIQLKRCGRVVGIARVDGEDVRGLSKYSWSITNQGYAMRRKTLNGKPKVILMHRIINKTPDGLETDHIDGNKLNNIKSNLRTVTRKQNAINRGNNKNSSSVYKGVIWSKQFKKWKVGIKANGKSLYLGLFECEKDAAETYDIAAYHLHKDFARLNFSGQ